MNFNQWRGHLNKGSLSKVTYCCGEQRTLVELVIQDIKNYLQVPDTDYVEVDASSDFWETASIYPLNDEVNRLVVVRDAEKITTWQYLPEWILQVKNNPQTYLLFVSYEPDAPAIYSKGKKAQYQEHIELIRTKGKFIKCSTPNYDDMLDWVQSYGLTEAPAKRLLDRSALNTDVIYSVLRKINVWNGSPNVQVIDLLCYENPSDSFVDSLIMLDKKKALLALKDLTLEDKNKIVSKLDARLDLIYELGKYVRRRVYHGEIAASSGIKIFLVKKFASVSAEYDFKKVKHCRQVLTLIDSANRQHAKTGVWEALVALW